MRKIPISDADLDWLSIQYVYNTLCNMINLNRKLFSDKEMEAFCAFQNALMELRKAYNALIAALESTSTED